MLDFTKLKLTRRPNQYLVAPPGRTPVPPHRESPVFAMPAADLARRLKEVALAGPRVELVETAEGGLRMRFVARSRIFRFPDLVDVEVLPLDAGRAALSIYARARYGYRDFGVNRARIDGWLARLAG